MIFLIYYFLFFVLHPDLKKKKPSSCLKSWTTGGDLFLSEWWYLCVTGDLIIMCERQLYLFAACRRWWYSFRVKMFDLFGSFSRILSLPEWAKLCRTIMRMTSDLFGAHWRSPLVLFPQTASSDCVLWTDTRHRNSSGRRQNLEATAPRTQSSSTNFTYVREKS